MSERREDARTGSLIAAIFRVQRRSGAPQEQNNLEERHDDGRH
jgi:hypothetical protein